MVKFGEYNPQKSHIKLIRNREMDVNLVGIDSQSCPMTFRRQTWEKIASEWKLHNLNQQTSVCSLEELDSEIDRILAGKQKGRVIVDLER